MLGPCSQGIGMHGDDHFSRIRTGIIVVSRREDRHTLLTIQHGFSSHCRYEIESNLLC